MAELKELEDLLKRLARERAALQEYGYRFPALFDAVEYLLRQRMPK